MFKYYDHLGFQTPYYILRSGIPIIKENFASICNECPKKRLDITAAIQILNKNYILGDRTILQGVYKTPWMAKPTISNTQWEYGLVPSHEEKILSNEQIAEKLFFLIQEEILDYVRGFKKVGVLLSGGMDSRIVAGTLDYLIRSGQLKNMEVTALTWGMDDSRDVVYAKHIADSLKWEWKHYIVDSNQLKYNIEVAALYGCEFSPIHLHAMPLIKKEKGIDCVLAGSFGDSIGRGEYSGKKILELDSIGKGFRNVNGLLKHGLYKEYVDHSKRDIQVYHERFPQRKAYQQYEQDYQLHYMRRMLNACMSIINERIPVYQVFTSPEVVSFMWSLAPGCRGDAVYKVILGFFSEDLQKIPWARTGIPYGSNGTPDNYKKNHHRYAEYISRDLLTEIRDYIYSGKLLTLGVFNRSSIEMSFKLLQKMPKENNIYLGEKMIWLAALAKAVEMYNITSNTQAKTNIKDYWNGLFFSPIECLLKNAKRLVTH